MTTKTSLMKLLAAVAAAAAALLCYSVDAFSASSLSRVTTTHHSCRSKPPRTQTRLFQGTTIGDSSTAASFPIVSSDELEPNSNNDLTTIISRQEDAVVIIPAAITTTTEATTTTKEELVPSTWSQALHRFFLGDIGPPLVLLTISGFIYTRCQLLSTTPLSIMELILFSSAIVIWWFQEYFFHRVLLHSPLNWIGKSIHKTHHDKDYFHVSIDPPQLLLGWLFAAHFIIKALIPQWHLCLSATIGYSVAGLVYEWSHYIVHTKVKPRIIPSSTSPSNNKQQSFLERMVIQPIMRGYSKMRDNHIRHHLIDSRYWYAFSVTEMDDLFHTNPNVKELKKEMKKNKEGFQ